MEHLQSSRVDPRKHALLEARFMGNKDCSLPIEALESSAGSQTPPQYNKPMHSYQSQSSQPSNSIGFKQYPSAAVQGNQVSSGLHGNNSQANNNHHHLQHPNNGSQQQSGNQSPNRKNSTPSFPNLNVIMSTSGPPNPRPPTPVGNNPAAVRQSPYPKSGSESSPAQTKRPRKGSGSLAKNQHDNVSSVFFFCPFT